MIGIYRIYNLINNKCYIGQSINIERRIKQHLLYFTNEKSILHSAIQKYGVQNFDWEILELCSIEELDEKERYWIKYYDCYGNTGYNATLGGKDGISRVIDYELIKNTYESTGNIEETSKITNYSKTLISQILNDLKIDKQAVKKQIKDEEKSKNKKIIKQIDPTDLSTVDTFNNQKEAVAKMGFSRQSLSRALHNNSLLFGYFWSYSSDKEENPAIQEKKLKTIIISRYDKNTNELLQSYFTYSEALKDIGQEDTQNNKVILSKIKNGYRQNKEAFGYIWRL